MSIPLQVGQVESVKRVFSQADFDRFAALSGDNNPIHVDPTFAARTKFGRTVAHGMFIYSVVCSVLGKGQGHHSPLRPRGSAAAVFRAGGQRD